MSGMSSAQIVSAGSAIHNKMPPALVGPLALHASTPVSYPGAVSPDLGREPLVRDISFFFSFCLLFLSAFLFKRATSFSGETTRRRARRCGCSLIARWRCAVFAYFESCTSAESTSDFGAISRLCNIVTIIVERFLCRLFELNSHSKLAFDMSHAVERYSFYSSTVLFQRHSVSLAEDRFYTLELLEMIL